MPLSDMASPLIDRSSLEHPSWRTLTTRWTRKLSKPWSKVKFGPVIKTVSVVCPLAHFHKHAIYDRLFFGARKLAFNFLSKRKYYLGRSWYQEIDIVEFDLVQATPESDQLVLIIWPLLANLYLVKFETKFWRPYFTVKRHFRVDYQLDSIIDAVDADRVKI